MTISATCDDYLDLYVDGNLLFSQVGNWPEAKIAVVTAAPKVVAMFCLDTGGAGGMLLSTNTSLVTDSSWRCNNALQEGWTMVNCYWSIN